MLEQSRPIEGLLAIYIGDQLSWKVLEPSEHFSHTPAASLAIQTVGGAFQVFQHHRIPSRIVQHLWGSSGASSCRRGHGRATEPLLVSSRCFRVYRAPRHGRWHCLTTCSSFQTRPDACHGLWPCPNAFRIFWDSPNASETFHASKDTVGRMGCTLCALDEPTMRAHYQHSRDTFAEFSPWTRLGHASRLLMGCQAATTAHVWGWSMAQWLGQPCPMPWHIRWLVLATMLPFFCNPSLGMLCKSRALVRFEGAFFRHMTIASVQKPNIFIALMSLLSLTSFSFPMSQLISFPSNLFH